MMEVNARGRGQRVRFMYHLTGSSQPKPKRSVALSVADSSPVSHSERATKMDGTTGQERDGASEVMSRTYLPRSG